MAFAPAMFRFRMMLRVGELMCLAGNRPDIRHVRLLQRRKGVQATQGTKTR